MSPNSEVRVTKKEAFQAVGLKWEGTFAEAGAGEIRKVHTEMHERLQEIEHVVNPETLLGLSYHITEGGFTHYAVVEVEKVELIPSGMVMVELPSLTYAMCEHKKGQNIDKSYQNIFTWIEQQGYLLYKESVTHFEAYPMAQDPYDADPEFTIMIPIIEKK